LQLAAERAENIDDVIYLQEVIEELRKTLV
jgi:hypothetical protein